MCVLLGYQSGVKGYKFYDVQSKQIFLSRDVVCHEEIFPFHTITTADQLIDPFPDLVLPIPSLYILPDIHDSLNQYKPNILHIDDAQTLPQTDLSLPITLPLDLLSNHNISDSGNNSHIDIIPTDQTTLNNNTRRSQRIIRTPKYYHCNLLAHEKLHIHSSHHIGNFLSYNRLSDNHLQFVLNVSSQVEPQYFHEAIKHLEWREAIKVELAAMESNHTWSVTSLPIGKNSI